YLSIMYKIVPARKGVGSHRDQFKSRSCFGAQLFGQLVMSGDPDLRSALWPIGEEWDCAQLLGLLRGLLQPPVSPTLELRFAGKSQNRPDWRSLRLLEPKRQQSSR